MGEQIFTSGQYKTQARPAVNPSAGFTETYYDIDNGGKLTTLYPDGSTIVLTNHLDDLLVSITRSGKDAQSIFTIISYYDTAGALRRTSTLSGGTSPAYTTRTEVDYAADGVTAVATRVYTQTYSGGDWISEALV